MCIFIIIIAHSVAGLEISVGSNVVPDYSEDSFASGVLVVDVVTAFLEVVTMKRLRLFLALGLFLFAAAGCASWFQDRVDHKDAKIEALEAERKVATTDEERQRIDDAIADEKADRDASLGGALEEQKNKQALLMALIALGTGGLKMAAGAAAKGLV